MSREIRQLRGEDLEAFTTLRSIAFPGSGLSEAEKRRILDERLAYTRGLFIDGELASIATMWPFRVRLGNGDVRAGGLAGVAAAPEQRRGGLVRRILLSELERLRDEGTGWCLEYPFDPGFYHRLGWQSVPSGSTFELPCQRLLNGRPPQSARRLPLSDFASLSAIFDQWRRRYTFAIDRRENPRKPWELLVSELWLDGEGFLYAFDGAYLLFTLGRDKDQSVMTVEDYAYSNGQARRDLFSFIGSMHGQIDLVRIQLPDDDPLALDGIPRFVSSRRWPPQARVVDLGLALAGLASETEGSLVLKLFDPLCTWNDGTFTITFGPDGVRAEATRSTARVELPIQTLPLLLTGKLGAAAALAQGQAEGDLEPLEQLASLAPKNPTFMSLADAF